MLEGTERFLKGTEIIGKYLLDLKEYSHHNDAQITRLDTELGLRITKVEYAALSREKSKKLKNKVRSVLQGYEERSAAMEAKMTAEMGDFRTKLQEIELNTYWKIKDYEELLKQRVSETYMKDYVKGEANKTARDYKEHVEQEGRAMGNRVANAEDMVARVRDQLEERILGILKEGE